MKHFFKFILLFFLGCTNNSMVQNRVFTINIDSATKLENYLVAYGDSVPIHKTPTNKSQIVGYLHKFEALYRFDFYGLSDGEYSKSYSDATWFPVKYGTDTLWVNRFDNVSLKYDVDTITDLVFLKTININTYDISYVNTRVIDLKNKKAIIYKYLDPKYNFSINDSLYIFNLLSDSIKIYNINQSKFIFETKGGANILSEDYKYIYFLKWSVDSVDDFKNHYNINSTCQLIQYDIKLNKDSILFVDDDLSKRPYYNYPDGIHVTDLKIISKNSKRYIVFDLYKEKQNPIDEGDLIIDKMEIEL